MTRRSRLLARLRLARRSRLLIAAACAIAVACGGDGTSEAPASPCVAFAKPPDPALRAEARGPSPAPVTRVFAGAGRTYAIAGAELRELDAHGVAATPALAFGAPAVLDAAVSKDARVFVARRAPGASPDASKIELVRFASADGGATFDAATEKVLFAIDGATKDAAASLAFGADDLLFFATGDPRTGFGAAAADPTSLLGKVLRIDVAGDGWASPPGNPFEGGGGRPEIYALGVRSPSLDVDPATGDVWLFDRGPDVDEIDRVYAGKNFGWPTREGARCVPPAKTCATEGLEDGVVELDGASHPRLGDASRPVVSRAASAAGIAASIVYRAGGDLVAVAPFGPSGTPDVETHAITAPAAMHVVGRTAEGEVALADGGSVAVVVDDAKTTAPATLLATKCFDLARPRGAPIGATPYDVDVPLWSDGATKERFAVVPAGKKIARKPDGDFVFPVGTVLVKSFAIDGKRVETRLFVQHDVEDWVGYSYRWKPDGSDAELVVGSALADLGGGKRWYYPSRADCAACHTPAAGYSLGPEARQLGTTPTAFDGVLDAPLDREKYAPLLTRADDPAGTTDAKARSYLHANCSICHRQGSSTALAEIDLRVDVAMKDTGLCGPPKTSTLGFSDPRIVAPGEPVRSTLLARMRALDDRRMPKLASHVVDDAGAALVERWIAEMKGCP